MDPTLTWLLLIVVVALIVIGAVRFDLLAARWQELFGGTPSIRDAPPTPPSEPAQGLKPHEPPVHKKPAFHRSGRRH